MGALAACSHLALTAVLSGERRVLAELVALEARLLDGMSNRESQLRVELSRAWQSLMLGNLDGLEAALDAYQGEARQLGASALVVDFNVVRAFAASLDGRTDDMLAIARRVSRMARTEALPAQEFSAHLMLGRARRRSGHPHLATHIFRSLEPMACAAWRPWLTWERLLAGDATALENHETVTGAPPLGAAGVALARTLRASGEGNRAAFDAAAGELVAAAEASGLVHAEAQDVVIALDGTTAASAHGEVLSAWCRGEQNLAPSSLHGLLAWSPPTEDEDAEADSIRANVLVRPGVGARRVLALGTPLLESVAPRHVRRSRRKQGRVETLLAVLGCAGDAGLDTATCFRKTYEFEYQPAVHEDVFSVLIHRTRAHVDGLAEIEHGDGRIALRAPVALLIPDPRCGDATRDRLLRLIARGGRATANEAARTLGISVRAAQDALKGLAEEGVCVAHRSGRKFEYAVEDTAFSEPTQRLARSPA